MQVLYQILSTAMAFLAFGWLYKGTTPLSQALVWNVTLLSSAICVGWFSNNLIVSNCRRRWVGTISGLLLGVGVMFLGVWWPWRGIDYVAASLLPGYLVGIAAVALGIRGLHRTSQGRGAYLLLAALGLAVLFGLISLQIRPSPERTVRRFARSIAGHRWENAYALLAPEFQQYIGDPSLGRVETVLRKPRGVILRKLDVHGPVAEALLFRPRGPWGHDTGFGKFDHLTLAKDDSGQWLISGTGRSELLRDLEQTHPRE